MGARAFEANSEIGDQAQRHVALAPTGDGLVVAITRVLPPGRGFAVVEDRLAVEAELDAAHDAAGRPDEHVLRLVVGRRAAVSPRPALVVVPGPHAEGLADDHPTRPRSPGRLEDEGPGQVAPAGRHDRVRRAEAEAPGRPIEDRPEHAGAIGSGQAHPLHPAARSDQRVDLAVGEEAVVGDRRERTARTTAALGRPSAHRRLAGQRVLGPLSVGGLAANLHSLRQLASERHCTTLAMLPNLDSEFGRSNFRRAGMKEHCPRKEHECN